MSTRDLPVMVIDGSQIDSFEDFVIQFASQLDDFSWGGSLDAFNDILRGGCGTPDGGFVLRWLNSDQSRNALGWPATIEWLSHTLTRCHPSNRRRLSRQLEDAQAGVGTTLFDWLVDIIRVHGPGGDESEGNVHLELV